MTTGSALSAQALPHLFSMKKSLVKAVDNIYYLQKMPEGGILPFFRQQKQQRTGYRNVLSLSVWQGKGLRLEKNALRFPWNASSVGMLRLPPGQGLQNQRRPDCVRQNGQLGRAARHGAGAVLPWTWPPSLRGQSQRRHSQPG
jgi:hypothetical protein